MKDSVSTFPLLNLPINAILNTLEIMNFLEIIGISILSKKTKNLVESLKLIATEIPVYVTARFEILLYFPNDHQFYFQLYQIGENEPIQELETPESIIVFEGNTRVTWNNVMSVNKLLDHLQYIFHHSTDILYFGPNCERFSLESIHKTIKTFEIMCFPSGNHEQHRRILRFFQPASLAVLEDALIDGGVPRDVLIQNFIFICPHSLRSALDDLLMINARSFFLIVNILSTKILNQFLKLWIKGSNPRLELMFLELGNTDFQKEELLERLKYQCAPLNRRRFFKVPGKKMSQEVIGGWDIWRFDGTQATISADVRDDLVRFELFVWHDHCVVN